MMLSEKLRLEACEASHILIARSTSGLPGHLSALDINTGRTIWSGHRDLMPPSLRIARDPQRLLSRPASD